MNSNKSSKTTRLAYLFLAVSSAATLAREPTLEEVIVTTQKRGEQNLQNIPVAVSVVSRLDIENRSISEFKELFSEVPNAIVHQYTPSLPFLSIRGVRGVGVSLDDVYLGSSQLFSSSLIDIERVEVLRGPQGTLSGKNTIGGLVRMVTSPPSMELEGSADLTLGDDELMQTRGYVSGPLVENRLAGKLAFTVKEQDGWSENRTAGFDDADGINFTGVRGQLLGLFGGDSSWLFSVDYSEEDASAGWGYDVISGGLEAFDDDPRDYSYATDINEQTDRDGYGVSLQVDWHWADYDLVSITAVRGVDYSSVRDNDMTVASIIESGADEDQDQFSQEFRILGQLESLSWLAGLYYFSEEIDRQADLVLGADLPSYLLGIDIPGHREAAGAVSTLDATSAAAFASGSWRFASQWELTGGIRFTSDEIDMEFEQGNQPSSVFPLINSLFPGVARTDDEWSDSEWTGDLALSYFVSDAINMYAKFARGYWGGGFDLGLSQTASVEGSDIDSETLNSYELGLKSQWLNNRLRFNAALFYSDYENMQELVFTGVKYQTRNVAESSIEGIELELTARVTHGFLLGATLGYQDASYDDFQDELLGLDYTGNRLIRAPEYTASAFAQYSYTLTAGWAWLGRVDVAYRDEIHLDASNEEAWLSKDHTLVDGRLSLTSPDGDYSVAAWVKNATDEDSRIGRFDDGTLGTSYQKLHPPRLWGVELRVNF